MRPRGNKMSLFYCRPALRPTLRTRARRRLSSPWNPKRRSKMLRRIGNGPLPEESLPVRHFEGFPYLVTHIVPALYHLIVLPAELDRKDLAALTRRQVLANRLKSCLVLGETDC